MSFGSGFHGGIAAGIILGGLIVGAQIIGSQIQTSSVPPYWELGPNVNAPAGGVVGQYPAIQAVSANSGRYDEFDPALVYVDDSGQNKFMYLTAGAASADGIVGASLFLGSTDSVNGPGTAILGGNVIELGTALVNLTLGGGLNPGGFDFTGTLLDQNGEIVPSFFPIGQTVMTNVAGQISIANPAGTTNVKVHLYCSGGAFLWKVNNVTASLITIQAYNLPNATALTAATAINVSGYVVKVAG